MKRHLAALLREGAELHPEEGEAGVRAFSESALQAARNRRRANRRLNRRARIAVIGYQKGV